MCSVLVHDRFSGLFTEYTGYIINNRQFHPSNSLFISHPTSRHRHRPRHCQPPASNSIASHPLSRAPPPFVLSESGSPKPRARLLLNSVRLSASPNPARDTNELRGPESSHRSTVDGCLSYGCLVPLPIKSCAPPEKPALRHA